MYVTILVMCTQLTKEELSGFSINKIRKLLSISIVLSNSLQPLADALYIQACVVMEHKTQKQSFTTFSKAAEQQTHLK